MSTTAMHPLAADYLRRLRAAGRHLPAHRLDDLCAEVESHLAEAIAPGASDAEALEVIERLGPPGEIIEAEQPMALSPRVTSARGTAEWAAIILLPLGGFAFGIGWLIGLVFLWSSAAWSLRDKLIGTLIVPGGIAAFLPLALLVGTKRTTTCHISLAHRNCVISPGPSALHSVLEVVVLIAVVVAPILSALYLARRAGRANGTA